MALRTIQKKTILSGCILFLLFCVSCDAGEPSERPASNICLFDIRGITLGMLESSFIPRAKIEFNISDSSRRNLNAGSISSWEYSDPLLGKRYWARSDNRIDSFIADFSTGQLGNKLFYMRYEYSIRDINVPEFIDKFKNDLVLKYGHPRHTVTRGDNYYANYGQACSKEFSEFITYPNGVNSCPAVEGCHMFVACTTEGLNNVVNIRICLFDGTMAHAREVQKEMQRNKNTKNASPRF